MRVWATTFCVFLVGCSAVSQRTAPEFRDPRLKAAAPLSHTGVATADVGQLVSRPWPDFDPPMLAAGWMAVHNIDVGQGDALLLEFRCGAILVDAGGERRWSAYLPQLAAYLNWFFEDRRPDLGRRLDAVVVSHSHDDHAYGLKLLLQDSDALNAVGGFEPVGIGYFVNSGYDRGAGAGDQAALRKKMKSRALSVGIPDPTLAQWGETAMAIDPIGACARDTIDPDIRTLWGGWNRRKGAPDNPNHHSVVMRVDYGESSLLLTGDLQTGGGMEKFLARYVGIPVLEVDVLKVSHHGAANGTTDALMSATQPCAAMIGVGKPVHTGGGSAKMHGHPRSVTMKRLQVNVRGNRQPVQVQEFESNNGNPLIGTTTKAIFATAWDGHHILYLSDAGDLHAVTQKGADEAIACP